MSAKGEKRLAEEIGRLTGRPVAEIAYPGGKSRSTIKVIFADGTQAFATRRRTERRGELELGILDALQKAGVRAPRILAGGPDLFVQSSVGETRLSQALHDAENEAYRAMLLEQGIQGLLAGQAALDAAPVGRALPVKGADEDWRRELAGVPKDLALHLQISTPQLDTDAIVETIAVVEHRCVKWDARPGNAIIDNGAVSWIDWDHAGRRNAVDDLVWLLCDEYVEISPATEAQLLHRYLPRFRSVREGAVLLEYVRALGVLHCCVRLELALRHRVASGDWWDLAHCMSGDKVGVTLECAVRLCAKGRRWAACATHTLPLVSWFDDLERAVRGL